MLRSILTRSSYGVVAQSTGMVVNMVLAPFIIAKVGLAVFGLWGLLGGLFFYLALCDGGMVSSALRFFSEDMGAGDLRGVRRLYGVFHLICLGLGVAGVLFVAVACGPVCEVLRIPVEFLGQARQVLWLLSVNFYLLLVRQLISALMQAEDMFLEVAAVELVGTGVYAVMTLVWLMRVPALMTLVLCQALQLLVVLGGYLVLLSWRGRAVGMVFTVAWDRAQFRRVFSFSRNLWLGNVSTMAVFEMQKLFLSAYVNLEAVAVYHLCSRLTAIQRMLGTSFYSPLTREATVLYGRGDGEGFTRLYRRSLFFFTVFQATVCGFLVFGAARILSLWLAKSVPPSASHALAVLALGMLTTLLIATPSCFSRAMGVTNIEMWAALVAVSLSPFMNILLVPRLGMLGACYANLVTLVLAVPVYAWGFRRKCGDVGFGSSMHVFWGAIGVAVGIVAGFAALNAVLPFPNERVPAGGVLALMALPAALALRWLFHVGGGKRA